ncbi:MAG: hypothetical protein ACK4NP_10995 [Parvularculaceae bacterium]
MTIESATTYWTAVAIYLAIGLAVAVVFAFAGAGRIDQATRGAGFLFRLLIIPGATLLWPLLLLMWIAGADRRDAA